MANFDGERGRENGDIECLAGVSSSDAHPQSPLGCREPYNATAGGRFLGRRLIRRVSGRLIRLPDGAFQARCATIPNDC